MNTRLTRRGEDVALALLSVSGAGLAHMWWTIVFDNPIDFPVIITTCLTTFAALIVMMAPTREGN